MLQDVERRKFLRLRADTEATLTRGDERLSVRLIDLSPTGCSFSTEAPVALGEALEIEVTSPSARIEPLVCSGRAVRLDREEALFVVGVEFEAGAL